MLGKTLVIFRQFLIPIFVAGWRVRQEDFRLQLRWFCEGNVLCSSERLGDGKAWGLPGLTLRYNNNYVAGKSTGDLSLGTLSKHGRFSIATFDCLKISEKTIWKINDFQFGD